MIWHLKYTNHFNRGRNGLSNRIRWRVAVVVVGLLSTRRILFLNAVNLLQTVEHAIDQLLLLYGLYLKHGSHWRWRRRQWLRDGRGRAAAALILGDRRGGSSSSSCGRGSRCTLLHIGERHVSVRIAYARIDRSTLDDDGKVGRVQVELPGGGRVRRGHEHVRRVLEEHARATLVHELVRVEAHACRRHGLIQRYVREISCCCCGRCSAALSTTA